MSRGLSLSGWLLSTTSNRVLTPASTRVLWLSSHSHGVWTDFPRSRCVGFL
jgi:hypothetical protein